MAEKKKAGKQESRGVLAQFHASGLTQRQFAEQEGVPLSTLSYWIRRERLERKVAGETTLVAVAEEPTNPEEIRTLTPARWQTCTSQAHRNCVLTDHWLT